MSDFDIIKCSCCDRQEKRVNFSFCTECEQRACDIQDEACGLHCPLCEWFVCNSCIVDHIANCWADPSVRIEKREEVTIFRFSGPETSKLDSKFQIFANEYGIVEVHVKDQ